MKSLRLLTIMPFLLCCSICFTQSNSPCKITDTLYIPFGYSHILTAESPVVALLNDLETTYDNVEVRNIDNPRLGKKIFRIGRNNYIYTFENAGLKDSCTYSIDIIEKDFEEEVPTVEIPNLEVLEDEIFEVEVRVKNIDNVVEANFTIGWDTNSLETLTKRHGFGANLAISSGTISGFSTRRETPFSIIESTISSFTFRANRIGETYLNLIKFSPNQPQYPTKVILDDGLEGKEIDVFIKGGLIKINKRPNCYTGATNVEVNICEDTYWYNGVLYNSSSNNGVFTDKSIYSIPFVTKEGCDSVVLLKVNRLSPNAGLLPVTNTSITICQGENYILKDQVYNQKGNYQATFTSTGGCDSIVNLQLDILPTIQQNIAAQICQGENYILNDQAYNQSGNYQATFSSTNGCDSIVNLQLDVLPIIQQDIAAQICQGDNYILNDQAYNQSGNYQATFSTDNGCDSIVNLQLDVLQTIQQNTSAQICQGENYILNNQIYNQSGNYQATFSTPNGCDSIVNLQLDVLPTIQQNIAAQICQGENYILNDQAYNQSGNYQAIFSTDNGCDSIVNLQLEVLPTLQQAVTAQICQGENYILNNQAYNQSGNYQATFSTINGCDSIVNLQLDVLPTIQQNIAAQICQGENYILNEQAYNQSGSYQATFTTTSGCDSIVSLQLTVVENIHIKTTATICDGESYTFDNQNLTQAGNYQKTAIGNNGCDSTINLELMVLPNYESDFAEIICQDENFILNNQIYTQSGQYQTTFLAANGCDSLVNLNLTVLEVPIAFADTVSTKKDIAFNFSVVDNDVLNGVNYEIQLIAPPHVGKLTLLEDGNFSYQPRFAYSGITTFSYQLCNEICLPSGCTTTNVTIHIEDSQSTTLELEPIPIPLPDAFETSRIQTIDEGEIFIYNIWGQLVEQRFFRQDSREQLWNLQQNELPVGIYFYVKTAIGEGTFIESGKLIAIGR